MNESPGKGWVWSNRLQKYRRPAIRSFMMDRQGIHIVLGLIVGGIFNILPAASGFLYPKDGDWQLALIWLATIVLGLLVCILITHIFLRYEEVEAKEIEDDAYIDIGGYLGGLIGSLCIGEVVMVALLISRFVG